NNTTPLGYVDQSGLLADPLPAPEPEEPYKPVPLLPFETEADARSALEAGQIQGYYVIPADYETTGRLTAVYNDEISIPAREQFYEFLAVNLLRGLDPAVVNRLLEGSEVVVLSPDGSRVAAQNTFLNFFLPMLMGIAFIIAMFTTGGYLVQAVTEEKENRTMEVIITSVSPGQFMAGKILGDIAIGLTQIVVWVLFGALIVLGGRSSLEFLRSVQIAPQTIWLTILIVLPSFVTIAALTAAIGAAVTEAREGQQVIGILVLPVWIPYMFMFTLMTNPNSPLAVTLSMLPFTAPLTILIRDGMTILPAWQIALSAAIQVATAAGSLWLAGRVFRLGMLRYGKRLRLREVFGKSY
ncbi:MAG: ABC transporter permease, partial [Anaerolineales bacterium]|nr:ABC transporter permease [Anaerolineales bacterium]